MKRTLILAIGILMLLSVIVWHPASRAQVGVSTSTPPTPALTVPTPPIAPVPYTDEE